MPQASPQDLKDLPQTLVGPSAWLGKDMAANPDAWLYSSNSGRYQRFGKCCSVFPKSWC